jgi:NAD(P)-dependent dehydrogenase (short-subunit alcohol dehydrogenase family)
VEEVGHEFGRIDGLVNNAGFNDGVGLEHGSPQRFFASLKCNLVHFYVISQATLPFLKQSKGSIVNMASKVAVTGQGGTSGYAAAKGAILELTAQWAEELFPYGIRVNAIVPAEVITPQYDDWLKRFERPEEELRKIVDRIPLGHRTTEPDEIAAMAVFLLSHRSGGVIGQHLFVDGGYTHLDRRLT